MPEFITDGALIQCDKGVAPSKLTVTSQQGCLIAGKPQATEKDKQAGANIAPFGVCSVTQKSCMPQPTAWQKAGPYTIDGVKELTTDSFCMCGLGGKIQFLQSGNSGFVKLKDPSTDNGDIKKDDEKEKPTPVDFLVHFDLAVNKPEDFKNDFGFDYMRSEYESIVKSDKEALKAEYKVLNNESCLLDKPYYAPWLAMFKDHKKLTGCEVKLKLHAQKLEATPNDEVDSIKFACPAGIEIYDEGGNTKIEKLKYSEIEGKIIQLKCTQSFSKHQYIAVVHAETKHSLGFLNLYKNNPTYKLNVTFVKVKFKGKVTFKNEEKDKRYIDFSKDAYKIMMMLENGQLIENPPADTKDSLGSNTNLNNMGSFIKDNFDATKKYLAQALIQLDIPTKFEEIIVNLGEYTVGKPIMMSDLPGVNDIKKSMKSQLGKEIYFDYNLLLSGLKQYYLYGKQEKSGVVIFILPINAIADVDSGGKPDLLDGFADKVNYQGRYVMLTKPTDTQYKLPSIIAHEIAHTLGLVHSFQSSEDVDTDGSKAEPSKHQFGISQTDNLMDYAPNRIVFNQLSAKDKKKDTLWKWQWEKVQQDIQDLTIVKE